MLKAAFIEQLLIALLTILLIISVSYMSYELLHIYGVDLQLNSSPVTLQENIKGE